MNDTPEFDIPLIPISEMERFALRDKTYRRNNHEQQKYRQLNGGYVTRRG